MANFINFSGKRLMIKQKIEVSELGIDDIIEPDDESIRSLLDCPKALSELEYSEKAKSVIKKFEITDKDYVHINGIDVNLILTMSKIIKANYIYSKMKKEPSGQRFITEFICFVPLLI